MGSAFERERSCPRRSGERGDTTASERRPSRICDEEYKSTINGGDELQNTLLCYHLAWTRNGARCSGGILRW